MATGTRSQRVYDHRLKDLVHDTGDIQLALRHGVPRSTARGWLGRCHDNVVTLDFLKAAGGELRQEVVALRRRNAKLLAVLRILVAALKVSNFCENRRECPPAAGRSRQFSNRLTHV